MKALVTGATGFIGSHVVDRLLERGHEVRVLVRDPRRLTWLEGLPLDLHVGDLTDPASLKDAAAGMDCVFHLAAAIRARTGAGYQAVNREGTAALVAAARAAADLPGSAPGTPGAAAASTPGARPRLVYVSSLAAGGPATPGRPVTTEDPPHPVSEYGRTKLAGEVELRQGAGPLPWVILRPPSVYGPREKDILTMFRAVRRGILPVIGGGRAPMPVIHVADLATAIVLAGESRISGRVYYVTDGDLRSFREVLEEMARAMGVSPLRIPVPAFLVRVLAGIGQSWSGLTGRVALVNRDKAAEMLAPSWACDDAPIRRDLGYRPRFGLDDGMADTVRWYRERGWLR